MNGRTRAWDVLSLSAIAASAIASLALYDELPDRVATHFDLAGNPNGWMPRAVAAAFIPVFSLVIWGVVRFLPRGTDKGLVAFIASLSTMFMVALHLVILRFAIDPASMPVTKIVWVLMGALFIVLGLVLPRVKRNRYIGIRTKWTLASDENWARTQRVGGYGMVLSGLVSLIAGGFGGFAGGMVALAAILAGSIVPIVYSMLLARQAD